MTRRIASLCLFGLALAARGLAAQSPTSFTPLFDGRSLEGWVVENSDTANFTVAGGVRRVSGPQGWIRSTREYGNFTLRVELRFLTDDADSGVFVRAPGPASNIFMRGWPASLNAVPVLRASGIVNPRGFIGIQGETGALEYRAIAVRER